MTENPAARPTVEDSWLGRRRDELAKPLTLAPQCECDWLGKGTPAHQRSGFCPPAGGPVSELVDVGVAPVVVSTADGGAVAYMPDRPGVEVWSNLEMLLIQAAAGHPIGDVDLPALGVACGCGEARVGELRIRHRDGKVLCVTCPSRPVPVSVGDPVAFRLASSDLFQYCDPGAGETVLRGVVEHVSARYQEVVVRTDWATPHTLDVTALVERPARLEDMSQFWPDKAEEQLAAVFADIIERGHTMTVTVGDLDDDGDDG